jgi:hypothetical protein
MVAEHHDQRLVGVVIEVGGAAGFGQPHGDPVGLEEGDDVQGLPAGEGRIECTHIFYDEILEHPHLPLTVSVRELPARSILVDVDPAAEERLASGEGPSHTE